MALFDLLMLALRLACLGLTVWALVDAAIRRADAFPAVSKQTKPFWLLILGLSLAVQLVFGVVSLFGIPALVAAIVYIVDVRPKVREIGNGSSW